jgi:hypothetical protein
MGWLSVRWNIRCCQMTLPRGGGQTCSFPGGATPAYKRSIHNKLMLNQLLELGYLLLLALDNREKFFLLRL